MNQIEILLLFPVQTVPMKPLKHFIWFILLLFALSGCEKIDGPAKNVFQTWEVKDFVSVESVTYAKNPDTRILLTINSDHSYRLQLDVNSCGGTLLSISELGIIFDNPACTEACCDSDFALRFASLLTAVNMYKIEDDTLLLSIPEWGFIECVRVSH